MLPTIEACWNWAYQREDMNAPFDFFVYMDAHEKARQLLTPLEEYFLDLKAFVNTFYNTYTHYCITTDYRVEYEKVWAPRPMTPLDKLPMTDLTPSETKPSDSIPMTDLTPSETKPNNLIPMTDLTNSTHSIPMTDLTPPETKPNNSIPMTNLTNSTSSTSKPSNSIPMANLTDSTHSIPMTEMTDAQRWVINTMYKKYNIAANAVIYNSVSDGSSSTSAQMFKSLNEGDFLMQDLLRTPYGTYVYQILEQMRPMAVLL